MCFLPNLSVHILVNCFSFGYFSISEGFCCYFKHLFIGCLGGCVGGWRMPWLTRGGQKMICRNQFCHVASRHQLRLSGLATTLFTHQIVMRVLFSISLESTHVYIFRKSRGKKASNENTSFAYIL